MTEADYQKAIIELARLLGFKVAHFRAAKTAHGWRCWLQTVPDSATWCSRNQAG